MKVESIIYVVALVLTLLVLQGSPQMDECQRCLKRVIARTGEGDTKKVNMVANCAYACRKREKKDPKQFTAHDIYLRTAKQVKESVRLPEGYSFQDIIKGTAPAICPFGQYVDLDSEECQLCPTGTYWSDLEPAWGCKSCPIGTFTNLPGQMLCEFCPPGYESIESRKGCRPCKVDHYSDRNGGTCQPCPKGSFTNYKDGSATCIQCDTDLGYAHVPESGEACSLCPRWHTPFIPDRGPPQCVRNQYLFEGIIDLTLF